MGIFKGMMAMIFFVTYTSHFAMMFINVIFKPSQDIAIAVTAILAGITSGLFYVALRTGK